MHSNKCMHLKQNKCIHPYTRPLNPSHKPTHRAHFARVRLWLAGRVGIASFLEATTHHLSLTSVCAGVCASVCMCGIRSVSHIKYGHARARAHTHIHTYIHTHAHTSNLALSLSSSTPWSLPPQLRPMSQLHMGTGFLRHWLPGGYVPTSVVGDTICVHIKNKFEGFRSTRENFLFIGWRRCR